MYFTYGTLFLLHAQTCFPISSHFWSAILQPILYRGGTAWKGDLKCREVKTGSGILGVIPIRIQALYDQQFKQIYSRKKNIIIIKNYYLPTPRLHKGRSSYKRSPQLSTKNIQHFKTWNFYKVGHLVPPGFRIRKPDPMTWGNPDPKPCFWDSH